MLSVILLTHRLRAGFTQLDAPVQWIGGGPGGRVASYRQLHSLTAHHEATQSVAKMLIHISVALSATVVWLT